MSINPAKANSSTSETFLTSLVTNVALLAVQVGVFLFLKQRFGRVYAPRTYLPPPDKRAEELPSGPWKWIPAVLLSNSMEVIHKNGLDAYMFLRFIRMLMIIFTVFTLVTWPVLLPVDAAYIDNPEREGIDRLSWGNITGKHENRYAAHIVIAYILTFFVIYMARREMNHFVQMRHKFLISKGHSTLAQARTVLITNLPNELANDHQLREFASFVPGGVKRTWVYRDTRELNKLFEARAEACELLEGAVSSLLRTATKNWLQRQAQHKKEIRALEKSRKAELKLLKKQGKAGVGDIEHGLESIGTDTAPLVPDKASMEFLDRLVPPEQRPTHRLSTLGFMGIGKKVETIPWCKGEIARLNEEIEKGRTGLERRKSLGTAFVECNLQIGAHVLAQCVSYHEPLTMVDKWIEVSPKDVIWANLDDSAYEVRSRYITSWMASGGLIILWAFPVVFVGALSNVDDLCQKYGWLEWICKAPKPIPGIIQGVIPPVLLTVLMLVLPVILRGLAWYENIPLYSLLSVSVYKRYYAFLVLHGFLIVTLTSGITSVIVDIVRNPTSTVEELAGRLPDASVFFLTYMVTQGFAGAASALIQLGSLVLHFIQKWWLGRTPRQAYTVTFVMPSADFGVVLPRMSLLATIGFAYSVISPIINGLAVLTFFLFFLAWKFLLTQVFDQPDEMETGGLYFPLAISNLFVGLYIEQICLICLFSLKIAHGPAIFIAQAALMALLLVITFTAQMFIRHSFEPLIHHLPMSLATKKMAQRYRRHSTAPPPATGPAGVVAQVEEEVMDLFNRDRLRSVLRHRLKLKPKRKTKDSKKRSPVEEHEMQETLLTKREPLQAEHDQPTASVQQSPARDGVIVESPISGPSSPNPFSETASPGAVLSVGNDGDTALARTTSASSAHSKKSAKSNKSSRSKKMLPTFDPPAAALHDADSDVDEEYEDHAFDHPSTYEDQVWIWVPQDALGFSEIIVEDLKAYKVEASNLGATMDNQGTVEVTRNPPDEEWWGGHDR